MMRITDLRLKCENCNTESGQPCKIAGIEILSEHSISTEYKCKCLNCGVEFTKTVITECEHLNTNRISNI